MRSLLIAGSLPAGGKRVAAGSESEKEEVTFDRNKQLQYRDNRSPTRRSIHPNDGITQH
jgi:hypothetical protein